jgi:hypothetical protein
MGIPGRVPEAVRNTHVAVLYFPVLANQAIYSLSAGRRAPYILQTNQKELPVVYL